MKYTNTWLLLVGTALTTTSAIAAPADIDSLADETLDQIIVSGAHTPITLRELGSAATVITRADIEKRETRRVAELLRSVPGFAVSHTGVVGSQTQVRVRGAEANHILVLIDGVRANDPATGDEFRWEYLNTADIERIEIVRGPQSALWGSDAVGAVVHIITRSSDTSSSGGEIDGYVESGSNNTANAGLNAAISNERWSLSANVERLDTDGENISRSGDEKDAAELTVAAMSSRFAATDSVAIHFGLRSTDAYSQFDPVDFTTSLPADADTATDTKNLTAHVGLRIDADRVSHHLQARYFDSENHNSRDAVENSSTASDRIAFVYQVNIRMAQNALSLGLEHEKTEFRQRGFASFFGDPNQDQDLDSSSLIAEYQNHSGDRFSWIVSARFDGNSDFDDALNGRLSFAYQLSDRTTLRAAAGSGQKNPTFIERFGFFPGTFAGNANLKPEKSTSYDIGIERSLFDGRAALQASIFHQDLTDEINGFAFDVASGQFTAQNIDGDSKRSGIEVAARMRVSEALGFGLHYTYTDANEQSTTGDDVRELRRPRNAGGVSADLAFLDSRLTATLNADYGGSRRDVFFSPTTFAAEIVTLDSYWLLDLAVQYRVSDTFTLFARGSNLLDDDYEQVLGYRTPGRSAYVGARFAFGQ